MIIMSRGLPTRGSRTQKNRGRKPPKKLNK
jgi:hypothetical protein